MSARSPLQTTKNAKLDADVEKASDGNDKESHARRKLARRTRPASVAVSTSRYDSSTKPKLPISPESHPKHKSALYQSNEENDASYNIKSDPESDPLDLPKKKGDTERTKKRIKVPSILPEIEGKDDDERMVKSARISSHTKIENDESPRAQTSRDYTTKPEEGNNSPKHGRLKRGQKLEVHQRSITLGSSTKMKRTLHSASSPTDLQRRKSKDSQRPKSASKADLEVKLKRLDGSKKSGSKPSRIIKVDPATGPSTSRSKSVKRDSWKTEDENKVTKDVKGKQTFENGESLDLQKMEVKGSKKTKRGKTTSSSSSN